MPDFLESFRRRFPGAFVSVLPDDTVIPWRLLSIRECLDLTSAASRGLFSQEALMEEVYEKCVLDDPDRFAFVHQKAGTQITVADDIVKTSYPTQPSDLAAFLNLSRAKVNNILSDFVILITQAFPSYTPSDLMSMNIIDFMDTLALAERKLLSLGQLVEPVSIQNLAKGDQEQDQTDAQVEPGELFETTPEPQPQEKREPREKAEKIRSSYFDPQEITPVPIMPSQEQVMISRADMMEHVGVMGDVSVERSNVMLADTLKFYPEYMEQMEKGEEVRISTVEERQQIAEERMKKNAQKVKVMHERQLEATASLDDKIKQKIEQKLKSKRRR